MYRTTRKILETLLGYFAQDRGLPCGHWAKGDDGKYHATIGGVALDHNGVYGGYEIQQIMNEAGGIRVLSGGRKSAREMEAWLRGALSGSDTFDVQ